MAEHPQPEAGPEPSPALRAAMALLVVHLGLSPLLFSLFSLEAFEFPKALWLRAAGIGLLALAAATRAAATRGRAPDPVAWSFGGLLVAGALASVWSLSPRTSVWGADESFQGLLTLAGYGAVFFATRICVRCAADARALLWAALAAAAAVSVYALAQMLGLDPVPWSKTFWAGSFARISSTLGNPNFAGGLLAGVAPVAAALALRSWRRGEGLAAGVVLAVLVTSALSIAGSFSRGSWGAAAVGLVALGAGWRWIGERSGVRVLAAAAGVAALLAAGAAVGTDLDVRFLDGAARRLEGTARPQREVRIEIWKTAAAMFAANPGTGVGLDAFQLGFPRYQGATWRYEQIPARAHNELLHTAATQGLPGLAALAAFAASLVLAGRRALARAETQEERLLVVAIGAGALALAARNAFGFTVIATGALFCSYAGMLSALGSGRRQKPSPPPLLGRDALAGLLALAALGGALCFLTNAAAAAGLAPGAACIAVAMLAAAAAVAAAARNQERTTPGAPGRGAGRPADAAAGRSFWGPGLRLTAACGSAALALYLAVYLPFVADARGRLGDRLLEKQSYAPAAALLEAAVRLDPGRARLWVLLGIAQHHAGKAAATDAAARAHLERALAAHRRAVALVPAKAAHHANVGRTLGTIAARLPEGADPEAIFAAFDAALERAPYETAVLRDACRAGFLLEDADAMERYAGLWLERRPGDPRPRSFTAAAFLLRADWEAAEAEMRAALAQPWVDGGEDEAGVWSNLAHLLVQRGRHAEALDAAERALALAPDHEGALQARELAREGLARSIPD